MTTSLDRFGEAAALPGLAVSLERRLLADRVSLRGRGAAWFGRGSFQTFGLDAGWRSTTRRNERAVRLRAGVSGASGSAPLALWSGAGTGHASDIMLRAHPLLQDGVVSGEVFGRQLVHAGVEIEGAAWRLGPMRLGLALFGDWATGWNGTQPGQLPSHLDVGLGVRLGLPGAGTLRVDGALGVRGGSALSVGFAPTWPN